MNCRILMIDDEEEMCRLVRDDFEMRGIDVITAFRSTEALSIVQKVKIDVLVTDLNMPVMNGLELCKKLSKTNPELPVIVLTAFGSMDTAISALRAKAFDFVTKPVEMEVLAAAVLKAYEYSQLQNRIEALTAKVEELRGFDKIIGESATMQELFETIQSISEVDSTILIQGESGTGKELIARCIHRLSSRSKKPFVSLNCSAIPANLIESELFGHLKGSFTDAIENRDGYFSRSNQGVLFLDEIGDMPLELQAKLLHVIENKKFRPIGTSREQSSDVRVVAATNKNLKNLVDHKLFRLDLFHRLNVIPIDVPPLRDRGNDVILLANYYFQHFTELYDRRCPSLSEEVFQYFMQYSWPGNVRELKNIVERIVVLSQPDRLNLRCLPKETLLSNSTELDNTLRFPQPNPTEILPLELVEQKYIESVLTLLKGNRTLAAKVLGVDRKTLYRKLNRIQSSSTLK